MPKPLNILIVEDSEDDALLMLRELKKGGYETVSERVETHEAMKAALENRSWDVIISDYVLPEFSGLAALNLLHESRQDLPFIILSGNIGEDIAVGAMKAGAHDYIIKGNLARLVPAIERELREAEVRREKRHAEEELRRSHEELERRVEERTAKLKMVLNESRQYQAEITALLEASRAVMEQRNFRETARLIFDSCKNLIGATAGYVALLSKDGSENEVLFLDAGELPCTVDPSLPMPVRGLRAVAYSSGKTVYENDFPGSEWLKFMPEGHAHLNSVMFAPLSIGTEIVGILGLANKKNGFTGYDTRMATAFSELASIALYNSRLFESLCESEKRLNRSQEIAHLGSWELDLVNNRLYWSDEVYRIFGMKPQEFGATYEAFIEAVHPDDRAAVNASYTASLIEGTDTYEIEHRVVRKLTGEVRIVHEKCSHIRDESGQIVRSIGMVHDITGRKRLEEERERLLNELMRSNRELEQFAYIASHDLQEPLRMVSSYVQLLGHRYKGRLDEDADEFIGYAVNGTVHMQTLLNDLLAYSRVGTQGEPFKLIDLNSALNRALINLKVGIAQTRAEIAHEGLPVVYADEVQMAQVFQNLLGNAMKFRNSGTPHINVSAEMKDNEWLIRVADNGIGIDPKYFDRIFDIFKRLHTKEEYMGTGIGLAICKKIIERHKGRIWVDSEPGKGSSFYFTIPAKE
jgi:PAS domain S-box-containing protein